MTHVVKEETLEFHLSFDRNLSAFKVKVIFKVKQRSNFVKKLKIIGFSDKMVVILKNIDITTM